MIGPIPHPERSAAPAVAVVSPSALAPPKPLVDDGWRIFADEIRQFDADGDEIPDWDDAFPIYGEIDPHLLPVGCNAYITTGKKNPTSRQYVWLRIDCIGDGPEDVGERWIGRRDDYHDEELRESGWTHILDLAWDQDWDAWMLREGIAPGQEFLVDIEATYTKSWTDYGYEYDVEFAVEIVARAPRSPAEVVAQWVGALPEVVRL